eukprot:gene3756-5807_t
MYFPRVRYLPMSLEEKAQVLSAAAAPRGLYGCAVTPYSDAQLQALRRAFTMALFPQHKRRCPGIVYTLFTKGHRLDPEQALPCECLAALRRMVDRRAELRGAAARGSGRVRADRPRRGGGGEAKLGWTWLSPWSFRTADGRELRYPLMRYEQWLHEVRDAARRAAWRGAEARRRKYHNDFAGLGGGNAGPWMIFVSPWRHHVAPARGVGMAHARRSCIRVRGPGGSHPHGHSAACAAR